jgi:hypothetical protein
VDQVATKVGLRVLARRGYFADGVVNTEPTCTRCHHVVTFEREFAELLGSDHTVQARIDLNCDRDRVGRMVAQAAEAAP